MGQRSPTSAVVLVVSRREKDPHPIGWGSVRAPGLG